MIRLLIPISLIFICGCLGPVKDLYPEDPEKRPVPVYLVGHGWHVGIAIEKIYIEHLLPEHPDIPQSTFLKFGWGDGRYYTDSEAGFWLMMRAAVLPTRSVIHVVGIDMPVERYFYASRIVRVKVSEQGAEKLGEFVADRFRRDSDGEVIYAADGLYSNSSFYEANGRYYLPKTSNTWTARALRQTGFPITPTYSLTSGNVIQQARKEGELLE
ncbi:MAG: DUF2459 domain-containing protein [Balneolaceae bacterium]|jgi:uncharacterized protein (TIGR02117 family)|nr:DUF2459 domain-containing protein [Balneolaceae bacterium]